MADQAVRVGAEQDLARRGRLLEPRGEVDRAAGHERSLSDAADHDLAGVDARPHLDAHPPVGREAIVQPREGGAHLVGGPDGAHRVVLVHVGDAEHRHHGVADELLDGAAVAGEDAVHLLEVARHHLSEASRVRAVRRGPWTPPRP